MHLASRNLVNVHSCKSQTPNKLIQTPNKLMHLVTSIGPYILEFFGWTTIYDFLTTNGNETSVLPIWILWVWSKINKII